jgi:N-ethylmaleimide reductase
MDELIAVFGADRVGIKLSPTGRFLDQYDSDPVATYSALVKELDKRKIAFI